VSGEELSARLAGSEVPSLMAKLGFSADFVAKNVMSSAAPVTVAQIAMLWMGMPNKHDRKRTRDMLESLAGAGLLKRLDPDTYGVL